MNGWEIGRAGFSGSMLRGVSRHFELGPERDDMELADGPDLHPQPRAGKRSGSKGEGLFFQEEFLLALDLEPGPLRFLVDGDDQRQADLRGLLEHAVSGPDLRPDDRSFAGDEDGDPSLVLADLVRVLGEEGERPLTALEVRGAHAGEEVPLEFLGRESDGHPQDGAEDAFLAEDLPERHALSHAPDLGFGERDEILPQGDRPFGFADPGR